MLIFLSILETDEERSIFTELYNKYGNAMFRVAMQYFPDDTNSAEDAVQNAWVRVVENFNKILDVPCKKRGSYLVIIVRNESVTLIRNRRQEVPIDDDFVDYNGDPTSSDVSNVIEIIQGMPEIYRSILEMRFVEERSTKDIAAALSLKETTVDVRIHRGRTMLMKKLREEGYVQ